MGNRLHIQIKREIEYGACGFNWQHFGLERLLSDCCDCDVHGTLDEDACGEWEIEESQFQEAVKRVEAMDAEKLKSYFDSDYAGRFSAEDFKKETVETLKEFERTGDHHSGFYHFSWF